MPGCGTECGIQSHDAAPATINVVASAENGSQRIAPLAIAVAQLPAAPDAAAISTRRDTESFRHGTDASLHVLNSVFRL